MISSRKYYYFTINFFIHALVILQWALIHLEWTYTSQTLDTFRKKGRKENIIKTTKRIYSIILEGKRF